MAESASASAAQLRLRQEERMACRLEKRMQAYFGVLYDEQVILLTRLVKQHIDEAMNNPGKETPSPEVGACEKTPQGNASDAGDACDAPGAQKKVDALALEDSSVSPAQNEASSQVQSLWSALRSLEAQHATLSLRVRELEQIGTSKAPEASPTTVLSPGKYTHVLPGLSKAKTECQESALPEAVPESVDIRRGQRVPCIGTDYSRGSLVQHNAHPVAVQPTSAQFKTLGGLRHVAVKSSPPPRSTDNVQRVSPAAPRDRAAPLRAEPPRIDGVQGSRKPPHCDVRSTMPSEDMGGSMQPPMGGSMHVPTAAPADHWSFRPGGLIGHPDGMLSVSAHSSAAATRPTLRTHNAEAFRFGQVPFLQVL